MAIIVQKFGGSSVADTEKLFAVCKHITREFDQGNQVVVVVSAQGKTTDGLVKQIGEIAETPSQREYDVLLSTGEQITIAKLAMCLQELGYDAISYMGWQVPLITDGNHANARIEYIESKNIRADLDNGKIVIVTGFQGVDRQGNITTFGRGGSDTTAVALAAALNADKCEIYTDVDGIFSSDPRIITNVKKIETMCSDEMLELASLGAKVLHSRCVEIGKNYDVPIHVKSTFMEESCGTLIKNDRDNFEKLVISGIAKQDNNSRITVICDKILCEKKDSCQPYKVFKLLADHGVNVDIIVKSHDGTAETDISFSIESKELDKTLKVLKKYKQDIGAKKILHSDGLSKISVVGVGMVNTPGVAAITFEVLHNSGIDMHMISTSEIKISILVDADKANLAMQVLHDQFMS